MKKTLIALATASTLAAFAFAPVSFAAMPDHDGKVKKAKVLKHKANKSNHSSMKTDKQKDLHASKSNGDDKKDNH